MRHDESDSVRGPLAPSVYRRVFEATPAPYLLMAPDFTIVAVNEAYLKATLTRREEILGRYMFEVFPDNPADPFAQGVAALKASLERVLQTGKTDTMPVQKYDVRRPAEQGGGFDERYWSPVNSPVLGDDGRVLYIIHRVEDVTDFMRMKQQAAAETKDSEALSRRIHELEAEMFQRARERVETNRRLHEANQSLAALDRAKTAFFSNVSHELRTPLTLMLGPLEDILQQASGLDDAQREELELAHRNALRLLKLVNTLLEFARIEAGRVAARYEPTDLASFTSELASVFRSAVERAGLSLIVDCPPLSEMVYVDRGMWEQIVLNLISNAFKFTLHGEIVVRLRARGDHVELRVRDTGTGIPEHDLPHLFERFYQAEGRHGRTQEGAGIGLALVHELVHLHGGTVRAYSREGEGSMFFVSIPFGDTHLPAEHVFAEQLRTSVSRGAELYAGEALAWLSPAASPNLPANAQVLTAPRARILLVEDNADLRGYLCRMLGQHYEVETVADGQTALATIHSRRPDLVVADVMMPGITGIALVRALRKDSRTLTLPIIILSARATEEARIEGIQAGADDYLVKPFSTRELLARVAGLLAQSEHARRIQVLRAEAEAIKAHLEMILESISDAFVAVDRDWRITFVNNKAAQESGQARETLIGKDPRQAFPAAQRDPVRTLLEHTMQARTPERIDYLNPTTKRWWEVRVFPSPEGLVVFCTDITERKAAERIAQHDPLTGLPNRALLYEFAEHLLAAATRERAGAAVLFVDLDRFKPINDTYGHQIGDAVLKQVATRLGECIRGGDLIARLGGDEFLAVLAKIGRAEDAASVARHALDHLRQPYRVDGLELTVTPSIGISLFPQDGEEIEELIRNADAAMYHAKENGQNDFQFFRAEFNDRMREALRIESRLRQGLADREFVLFYQPVVDTETVEVVGAEALLRWPAMNSEPGQFIPVAEKAGMIRPLGNWVLQEACRQQREWADKGGPSVPIAVNVSPLQFRQKNFVASVGDALQRNGLSPASLRVEVTEGTLMADAEAARHILSGLQAIGVKVALDDFGTGYSSLGYLSRLPIDILKLDQTFVQGIGRHDASTAVVEGIIALGRSLGLEVIAEGVESAEVAAFLREHHCDRSQGFHFSPPMPPEQFERWWADRAV
ncbi:hypothetical protein dqs_2682 [Azoarcus olearius]|nr:hypothetical protein dqs_2682 [Azoarcus olearius]